MYTHNININYSDNTSYNFKKGYKDLLDFYDVAEKETKKLFTDIIQKDWNIIDVGANIGMYSALFGILSDGDKFLIEASNDNMIILKENLEPLEQNGVKFIYVNDAFGDKLEDTMSTIHYLWTGKGSVLQDTKLYKFNTIDNLLKSYDKKINLIKIDVDGFDYQVLRGAEQTLKNHKPMIMFELMEETLNMAGYNSQDVFNFLEQMNYKVEVILDKVNYIFTTK
jgi:FkbM family methyltransferase